jgi:hypothetical protein
MSQSALLGHCARSQSFTLSCTTRIALCTPIAIPHLFCLSLSFYTHPYSYLLSGALGRVPCTSPHPKMQLQRLPCGTVYAATQRRRRPLTPCSKCAPSSSFWLPGLQTSVGAKLGWFLDISSGPSTLYSHISIFFRFFSTNQLGPA